MSRDILSFNERRLYVPMVFFRNIFLTRKRKIRAKLYSVYIIMTIGSSGGFSARKTIKFKKKKKRKTSQECNITLTINLFRGLVIAGHSKLMGIFDYFRLLLINAGFLVFSGSPSLPQSLGMGV